MKKKKKKREVTMWCARTLQWRLIELIDTKIKFEIKNFKFEFWI